MVYSEITYKIEDDIARINLNSPKNFNAISQNMANELLDALTNADNAARVVIISSEGDNFCSGANLLDTGFDLEDDTRDLGLILETTYNPVIEQLRNMDTPIITALKGAVVGIGCSVALMGDLILARDDTYIMQSFKNIALVPDGGSAYLLARAIGRVRAMEMMLMGHKVGAKEALDNGLFTRVYRKHDFDKSVNEIAHEIAKGPTKSWGYIRKIAWDALDNGFFEHLQAERHYQCAASRTKDFVEGVKAFREKRKVSFSGE